jgi:DUF1365 family protein
MSSATATAPPPAPAAAGEATATTPAGLASAIYEGTVFHRRSEPVEHAFAYPIFLPLFDLDELPGLLDPFPLWSARRRAPARFRRDDYLGPPERPLAVAARDLVEERTGRRPEGPVRLLANPRYWGIGFNPVTFLYLHGAGPGAGVEAIVAEVTNTPWGERRSYVLEPGPEGLSGTFDKALHVSPFMPMEQSYRWTANEPGDRLAISLANHEGGRKVFEAGLSLERREITRERMLRLLATYPPATAATIARIYWNALRLKLKGVPYFRNPRRSR